MVKQLLLLLDAIVFAIKWYISRVLVFDIHCIILTVSGKQRDIELLPY